MSDFLVDILMPAYNHELYIEEALLGVVLQETNFKFRLLIADDFSKDNTRKIIEKYQLLYPDVIFPFYRSKNLGAFENSKLLFKQVKSKYIALCEGDDYWIDKQKLQKQVDFLEQNESFVACCADAYERIGNTLTRNNVKDGTITFDHLSSGNSIYTCTAIYRNLFVVPDWFEQCKMGDWVIWLTLTQLGPIHNIQQPMAVYRIHNNGMWFAKGKEQNLKDVIASYNIFLREFKQPFLDPLKRGAKQYYTNLLSLLAEKSSFEIFPWTFKAFSNYHDIKQFRYLLRYVRNKLLPASSKKETAGKQSSVLP